ncbi:hypothetical protein EOA23_00920 [Mesorhizobium sp. M2A.F.Ca.ET.042.01.1.1]|uniref:hypothetical protein n=1 Tax=Mesorhizobium sp. M2A.F.Ca.ET.042.01.1.1 TaxID=2496745 RepID=UPI000FCB0A06|nr:hypothetical protein [Mesorhizobium sp. M2A.F.Ca.ET.042.01.1.1]RUX34641.1 hypothetical protein EOA23_00920 [Mesorhizobium sp. M2A.F.Ca.ET.042.01.1.1]
MADLPQATVIEWSELSQLAVVPAQARVAAVTKAPDGRSVSILMEGLDARCEGKSQKSATAVLVASIDAKIPAGLTWTATRADFRGQLVLTNGGRATVQLGLARGFDSQTVVSPLEGGEDSLQFVRTIYSPAEIWPQVGETDDVFYAPLTVTIQLTLACPGDPSAGLAALDSVDVELWVR